MVKTAVYLYMETPSFLFWLQGKSKPVIFYKESNFKNPQVLITKTPGKSQTLYNLFKLAEFCVFGKQSHPTIIYESRKYYNKKIRDYVIYTLS